MGRIAFTEGQPPKRARRLPRIPPLPWGPVLAALVLVVVLAPDPFLRAVCAIIVILSSYAYGWRDGKRDLAVDLLRGGRDSRPARPTPPSVAGAKPDDAPVT